MAVVRSSGSLVAVHRAPSPTIGPGGVALYEGVFADYDAIYRTQPHVRTVISFLARNFAQIGLHVFRRVSDTDRQRLTEHPLARAINAPNPWTTRYHLFYSLMSDRCIYDHALWVKFRSPAPSRRLALVRIPPERFRPVGDNWLRPEDFEIVGNRGTITIPAESAVYFHGYNPGDNRTGISPMETMRRIVAEEHASGEYRENFWRNAARMEHVITRPKDAPQMSAAAKDRFWARWNAQYTGAPNSAKTALLEEGMDVTQLSSSAKDAQYIEGRKFNLEEAARFYHVPLPQVGILDNANYSNMQETHKQLYQDTLGPDLVAMQEEIELQLLPEFPDVDQVYAEFNIAEKLKGSFEEQAKQLQTSVGAPFMTRNEARARVNLPAAEADDADRLVVPLNVLVGGQASPTDSAPTGTRAKAILPAAAPAQTYTGRVDQHRRALVNFFDDQATAVLQAMTTSKSRGEKAPPPEQVVEQETWTDQLAGLLLALGLAVVGEIGGMMAARFGALFDIARATEYLSVNAQYSAANIQATTTADVQAALAEADPVTAVEELFETAKTHRAGEVAQHRVNWAGNFAITEGGKQAGVRTKTWQTTSGNPRPSHAAAAGQTVDIDGFFSVGGHLGKYPHHHQLGPDEIAGCQCTMTLSTEAPSE